MIFERRQLLITLRQAYQRAVRTGRDVLASFSQPVEPCASLRIFTAFQFLEIGELFFWEQPTEHKALVGVGTTVTIETTGTARFTDAATTWHNLRNDAVIRYAPGEVPAHNDGPLLFGGFAFDPLHPHTSLWEGFPDGLLTLPHLLFNSNGSYAALTINVMIHAHDDIERCIDGILSTLQRLSTLVEQIPSKRETEGSQTPLVVQDLLPASEWAKLVANTVQKIQHGTYQKVVLARGVQITNEAECFDIGTTLYRLRESYPGAYIFAIQRGDCYFVGATPEQLVLAQNGYLKTMALAGSAPRGKTEEEDRQLGRELLHSEKNKEEHEIVVAMIRDTLATFCSEVTVSGTPQLLQLKNIQHLETPIFGQLLPRHSVLNAVQSLHPTPAVGGFPRQAALEAIRADERLDRGWYASPIGWIDGNGNGEFAVALRSGLVEANKATLFVGCGIVADSQPENEYAESCLKLRVMLRGLGNED